MIERLARLLASRSGEMLVYASLAREINVSEPTVKTWVSVLKSLYYGFEIRPWFKNIENSLRKTSKWYLRDWSAIEDGGRRNAEAHAGEQLSCMEAVVP